MANIENLHGNSMPKINWKEVPVTVTDRIVDLSNNPNLTARIKILKYFNGEGKMNIEYKFKDQLKSKPPKREGELINKNGLNRRAKGKIKLACRCMQELVLKDKKFNGFCSFITLTYATKFPDDHLAKKHLDAFLKRLRRKLNNFHYVWVAEKQKRGAIHFHIVTPNYIDKHLINKMWNQIINRWQMKNNFETAKLYPNIKAVNSIASYMAKYLSKEGQIIKGKMYGMSGLTQELISPKEELYFEFPTEIIKEVVNDVYNTTRPKNFAFKSDNYNGNPRVWSTSIDPIIERIKKIYDSI